MSVNTTTNLVERIINSNGKQIIVQEALPKTKGAGATIPRRKASTSTGGNGQGKVKVTKRRSTSSKQSKDKPKRALCAYNIFFKYTRSRIVVGLLEEGTKKETIEALEEIVANSAVRKPPNSRQYRKTHNQISFADLARRIAEKWRTIDSDQKKIFEQYASIDAKRYRLDMKNWKEKKENELEYYSSNSSIQSNTTSEISFESSSALDRLEHRPISGNFGNQFSHFHERSSIQQHADTSSYGTNKGVTDPLCGRNNRTAFDEMSYQEMLSKNQQLEESINSLQRELCTTNILDPEAAFFEKDDHLQNQNQQQQVVRNNRGLTRAFSGGPSIDRTQQLHRRRVLMNTALSFPVGNNNIDNHVDGLHFVENRLANSIDMERSTFHASHHEFSQYNNFTTPLKLEGGLESPLVVRKEALSLNGSNTLNYISLLTDKPVEVFETAMMIGKEIVVPQINDTIFCDSQVDHRETKPIRIGTEMKSRPPIDEISPTTLSIRQRKNNDISLHTHQINDDDIQLLEMAIGDDKLVMAQHAVTQQHFHDVQEDFWNKGCENLG